MTRLSWSESGKRLYEAGIDRGVLYSKIGPGVSWNGLITVNEDVDGESQTVMYVDGQAYVTQVSLGSFAASIGAITYPQEFEQYDGYSDTGQTGQDRESFNLSYRTMIGNDIDGLDHGYKIHLVYNALAAPSNRVFSSLNASPDVSAFEWKLSTTPVTVARARASSHLIIDTRFVYLNNLEAIENILYGTEDTDPLMPGMSDVLALFESNAIFKITDHGDGTFTADGPDDAVELVGTDLWKLEWPSVIQIDSDLYQASSL